LPNHRDNRRLHPALIQISSMKMGLTTGEGERLFHLGLQNPSFAISSPENMTYNVCMDVINLWCIVFY
jgi:hypothetical protein